MATSKRDPKLKAGVAAHLEETRRQQQMLEQLLGRFGEAPSTLKEMVMKLTGNLQSMFHASTSDEVLKNLFALYAFEHFEQASYLSLIAMAEECGEAEVASTCRQILQEEEAAGEKLRGLILPISQAYLQREAGDMAASR
jgi:ferritin-like metal-binding protein YciE